jgi:hypothetical protein
MAMVKSVEKYEEVVDFEDEVYEEIDDLVDDEIVLEYVDDLEYDLDFADLEKIVYDRLEEYSIEELLDFNDMEPAEAMTHLFSRGLIGLPTSIDEDSEEIQDIPEEIEED